MNIHAHVLCYNEEKMLPFFLDHYSQYCSKIFIYNNMSTDSSMDIARSYEKDGLEIVTIDYDTGGTIRDDFYIYIKQDMYKKFSRDADWVFSLDMDEFIYHEDLLGKLKEYKEKGITYPKIQGYQMVAQEFPTKGPITETVKTGFLDDDFSKRALFDPSIDVLFGIGCHPNSMHIMEMSKQPKFKESEEAEIKLLHYAYLSEDGLVQKCQRAAARLSNFNKKAGLGTHYQKTEEQARQWHRDLWKRSEGIIR